MAPGPLQILIVVLLIFFLFGASRVPMIAENLAKGIRSFKKGLNEDDADTANAQKSAQDTKRAAITADQKPASQAPAAVTESQKDKA